MKPKEKIPRADTSKQKKQLMILGGLVVVLGIVLAVQFGHGSTDASAATAPPEGGDPASVAQQLASDPAAAAAAAGMSTPVAAAPAPSAPVKVEDNPVLSEQTDGGLLRSPFTTFFSVSSSNSRSTGGAPEIAPPAITLNATMPSASRALAVIDGEVHFVGDVIQGWELAEIQARRILLRSPSRATVAVDMPLLTGVPSGR